MAGYKSKKLMAQSRQERIIEDIATMDMIALFDSKYDDKYFVHRVIRFLRDNPERAPDYIDFVPDWETRNIDDI